MEVWSFAPPADTVVPASAHHGHSLSTNNLLTHQPSAAFVRSSSASPSAGMAGSGVIAPYTDPEYGERPYGDEQQQLFLDSDGNRVGRRDYDERVLARERRERERDEVMADVYEGRDGDEREREERGGGDEEMS
ncbi:hypothetical protein LTR27_003974 [Elasticomyces elasticus]|nr:hypothetical protein LTR27_003974 [Elasticomyces elasticus]